MAKQERRDPTVRSGASAEPSPGAHEAVPVEEGADAAAGKEYRDNPDKPDPSTKAQVEVLPSDK